MTTPLKLEFLRIDLSDSLHKLKSIDSKIYVLEGRKKRLNKRIDRMRKAIKTIEE